MIRGSTPDSFHMGPLGLAVSPPPDVAAAPPAASLLLGSGDPPPLGPAGMGLAIAVLLSTWETGQ